MKKKLSLISMGMGSEIPGIRIFLFNIGSKTGTIDFIVDTEDKFISSAIKIYPLIDASINGPL